MSREDLKSFRNALVVMSGLAILAPVAVVGWTARSAIAAVEEKASKAIAAVSAKVNTVELQVVGHVALDDQRVADLKGRVDQCCPVASASATWGDAVPPDRRRRRFGPQPDGGG